MTNARIERMSRELNAEPAAKFFGNFVDMIAHFFPQSGRPVKVGMPAKARLAH
jgi:hypothetical protein